MLVLEPPRRARSIGYAMQYLKPCLSEYLPLSVTLAPIHPLLLFPFPRVDDKCYFCGSPIGWRGPGEGGAIIKQPRCSAFSCENRCMIVLCVTCVVLPGLSR